MEHLPECIYKPEYWDVKQSIRWSGKQCICSALRACEQRVIAQNDREWAEQTSISDGLIFEDGWSEGYESALDLVEVVIFALDTIEDEANGYSYPDRTTREIVDAINKLREEK